MMTLPRLLLATALALAAATGASAYSFSPPDTSVRLHGKVTFTPNEGGHPFSCSVTMDLKTKVAKRHSYEIKVVKFPHGACGGIEFVDLPWPVAIQNANSGVIGSGGFVSSDGNCVQNWNQFHDNGSGI